MPQLNQLSDVILSQLFWLAIVLGFIYFFIGRGMVPKIQSTVDKRNQRVAEDLAAAERAKAEADEAEEAYRRRMDTSRAQAIKLASQAKQEAALRIEKLTAAATAANQAKLDDAEERIRAASESARAKIAIAVAEITQEVVAKVYGLKVSKAEALRAVERDMAGG
jgi:F-type H+-transporting ATPase subunit b